MKSRIVSLFAMLLSLNVNSQEIQWKLKNEDNGVVVYTGKIPGFKYKTVKTETSVSATIPEIIEFLKDVKHYPVWISNCHSAEIIGQLDSSNFYVYQVNKVSPGNDRDMVVHISFIDQTDTSVTIQQNSIDTIIPEKPDVIRIARFNAKLSVIRVGNMTHLVYTIILDPGGDMSAFLVNKGIPKMFLETTLNLRASLEIKTNMELLKESKEVKGRENN